MPAAVKLRRDYSAEELRALARRSKDVNQSRRLLSLAAVRDGKERGEAARNYRDTCIFDLFAPLARTGYRERGLRWVQGKRKYCLCQRYRLTLRQPTRDECGWGSLFAWRSGARWEFQ
jgi:hypothetical protein